MYVPVIVGKILQDHDDINSYCKHCCRYQGICFWFYQSSKKKKKNQELKAEELQFLGARAGQSCRGWVWSSRREKCRFITAFWQRVVTQHSIGASSIRDRVVPAFLTAWDLQGYQCPAFHCGSLEPEHSG